MMTDQTSEKPLTFYNIHRVKWHQLEDFLNGHARRGWTLHNISALGEDRLVTFVRTFATLAEQNTYLLHRAERLKAGKAAGKAAETQAGALAPVS